MDDNYFFRFSKNRTRKTKRWLSQLMFCIMLLLGQTGFAQFPAPYCNVTFPSDVEPITLVQFGTINNTSSATVNDTAELQDFTAISTDVHRTGAYSITLKGNTNGSYNNYFKVFVDWNQNGNFNDPGESYNIGFINGSTGVDSKSLIGSISVPLNATLGATRMRVTKKFNDYAAACNSSGYGQAEDYTLNVLEEPTCLSPTALTATNLTTSGATLGWTSAGDNFEIEWGAAGFEQGGTDGTVVSNISSNSYDFTVSEGGNYQFYVRQDCGDGDLSFWAGPFSFRIPLLGEDCSAPIVVGVLPYTTTNDTANFTNNPDIEGSPGSSGCGSTSAYLNGNDVVYAYTATFDGIITIDLEHSSTYTGIFAYANCDDIGNACIGGAVSGSSTADIGFELTVENGETYYFVISTWATPQTTAYTLEITRLLCPAPSDFSVSDITTDSATLNWLGTSDLYDIEWGETGFEQGGTEGALVEEIEENLFELDNLESATTYQYYVRQNCGVDDGVSVWKGPFSFTTACELPDSPENITFTDVTATATKVGFEAPTVEPTGYVVFRSTSDVPPVLTNGTTYTTSQTTAIASLTTDDGDTYFCVYNGTGLEGNATSLTSNTEYYYYVFSRNSENSCAGAPWYSTTSLIDSEITAPATPTSAVVSNLTNDSATISWTASAVGGEAGAITYTLQVYTDSAYESPIAGSPFAMGADVSHDLTGLATSTQYYFRIKGNNTYHDSAYLTGSFTTTQIPATLNYVQGFEGTHGWALVNGTHANKWYIGGTFGNPDSSLYISKDGGVTNTYNTSGTYAVQAYRDIAVSAGVSDATISFDWKNEGDQNAAGTTQYDYFRVWLVPVSYLPTAGTQISSGSGRIQIGGNFVDESDWVNYENTEVDLSSFAGEVMRLVFEWRNDYSGGTGNAASIDNIEITLPACAKPTGLGLVGLTPESAELSWESLGDSFEVKWGASGFDMETEGTLVPSSDITGMTHTINGLTADTSYEFYVRQDCGTDGMSAWAGPYAFYTGYCIPTTTGTYFINQVTTTGANVDISNNTPIRATGGYGDYTETHIVEAYEGQEVEIFISANTSTHNFFVWIDLDNNMIFDNVTEKIIDSSSLGYAISYTGTITIPALPLGDYRVRIGSSWSGSITPCGSAQGEYEDYTLRIIAPPTCYPPLNIGVDNITKNTAKVTWEAPELGNEPEDGYVIEIRTEGAPGEATGLVDTVTATGLSATLSGLAPDTSYTIYIKTLCTEDDDESFWSAGVSFTTMCDYPDYELINTEDDLTLCGAGSITLEADSEGTVNWYDAADATEPIFTGTTFETEDLTETTSFWVESVAEEGGVVNVGPLNPSAVGASQDNWTIGWYVTFTVHKPTILQSIDIFPITIGQTGTVQIRQGVSSTLIETISYTTTVNGGSTPQTIPIDVELQPGTYNLNPALPSAGLKRNPSGASYPYSSEIASITGNEYSSSYYMGFYNWVFESSCKSPREEVVVTVIPSFDIISAEVEDVVGDSATLFIESEGTVFEIEYGESGFTPGDATGTNIPEAGSTYVLEDLATETSYDVYVRASSCAEWFGPVSFTTIIAVNQTITAEDVMKVYGDAPFINGASDSGLALSYTIEDESVAVFEDGQIVIVGAGATEITASQAGSAEYLPAEEVTFTLTVGKAPLTISVEDVTKAYDGEVYAAWTIVYDEFVNDDDAADLSGELIYSGEGVTAITPGTYAIEIGGLTSNNYDITFVGGTLTITKAELTGITFEDALLIYDGTAKSIAISGELPNGVTVTYTGNGQTEVGDYLVAAAIDGGANYEDMELEAVMKIRMDLSGAALSEGTFTYDGSEKTLELSGLPADFGGSVTWINNGQTEAGIYEVTANIDGGSQYESISLTATLTIEKAELNATLPEGTFTYDGSEKSLAVTGLPAGFDGSITYTGNNQTEAGVYEVVANIDGDNNYEGLALTAELTIVKSDLSDVLSLANASFVYDGDAQSLAVSGDIPTGVTVNYTGNGQTEAGVYEVTATINGGNNYESLELTAELTIEKAEIADIVFADGIFGYDGSAKSLVISGTLPAGASVSYTGNGQSELGEYEVVATIDGGTNYNDLELTATLTITEGTIPGITFADGYFVYDGSAKSIYISGELPQGSTVSYSNNGQTEAGTYVVTATISGGGLYNDLELSASLTIAKAQIQDLVFADGIFTYDATEKSLHINGSLPSGVSVSYQNNGKVNAGVYTVVANISGNANYAALRLTAVLTIEKAPQQINFAALAPVSVTASDFQLTATASSGLAVRYSYSYDTATPAAEVSNMGWVTVNHLGEITITVSQEGNSNYQAAAPVSRVLTVINKDASVRELWIENEYYSAPQREVYHLIDCTDLRSSVSVRIVAGEGASIAPGKEFTISVPKPGIYTQSVTVTSQDGSSTEEYVIVVEKPFSFKEIAEQKFNNTLLINNNPKTNGGYRFVAYQWFKDGELVGEEQAYSAGSRSLLDSHSVYHGIVTTEDGQEIHVCPMEVAQGITQSIQLYPNPVRFGGATTLSVSSPDAVLKGLPVKIYNLKGQLVHTVYMDGDITTFELPQSMQSGMYIAVFELAGQQQSIKFIVE